MSGNFNRENRETPSASRASSSEARDRSENATGGNADAYVLGESDESIVPSMAANKGATEASAEQPEERDSANRNVVQPTSARTSSRTKRESLGLHGVRERARTSPDFRFTCLLHHVNESCLTEAFFNLKKHAKEGIDGVTWHDYEANLEANITDLHGRIHRGAYRAKPAQRAWIRKPKGGRRPLAIVSLEDKIVQTAVRWVLQAIYERDFLDFSYGFRPGRNPHMALDSLSVALTTKRVNWVLDADLESFFDSLDHEWLIKFVEHRIGDNRILRLIRKWLHAGVIEEGAKLQNETGSPQGSVISPLLSNVYLHYVLDLWIHCWRQQHGRGDVIIVRYADDFVIGFERRDEAEECLEALRARLAKFGLKLNDEKTRLIEFGRYAAQRRQRRGEGRPETFDFLGFTHQCSTTRRGSRFVVRRESIASRMIAKLAELKLELRKRWHDAVGETGRWLGRVLQGWLNYHAIPLNMERLQQFRRGLIRLWLKQLRRRSQRHRWTWERMYALVSKHLPRLRIIHPYPDTRHHARLKARAV